MVKIISLLGFMMIYFSAWGQKASYYIDPSVDLNQFVYFCMPVSSLNEQELRNPFLDKSSFNHNNQGDFIVYNEISLKNLTLLSDNKAEKTLNIYLYEGATFETRVTPKGYKPKKLKGQFLILDLVNSTNDTLVWRGWIDLKKVKSASPVEKYHKAIIAILTNLKIEPIIIQ